MPVCYLLSCLLHSGGPLPGFNGKSFACTLQRLYIRYKPYSDEANCLGDAYQLQAIPVRNGVVYESRRLQTNLSYCLYSLAIYSQNGLSAIAIRFA